MGVKHFVLEWSSKGARNSRKRDNQIRIWSYAYERQQLIGSNSYDIQQLILWSYAFEMQQFIWSYGLGYNIWILSYAYDAMQFGAILMSN